MLPMYPANTWIKYLPAKKYRRKKTQMSSSTRRRCSLTKLISTTRSSRLVYWKLNRPCSSNKSQAYWPRWVLGPALPSSHKNMTLILYQGLSCPHKNLYNKPRRHSRDGKYLLTMLETFSTMCIKGCTNIIHSWIKKQNN